MGKLSAKTCETAKPNTSASDRLLGDGDGLFLRISPHGTKTWVVEYDFQARRRKYTIGVFDPSGAHGESITASLEHGRLSLAQARAIAGQWKYDRRAGRDPVAEWETRLEAKRAAVWMPEYGRYLLTAPRHGGRTSCTLHRRRWQS